MSSSSEKFPTLTLRLALALSVFGSWTRSASSLFGSSITLYDLSSVSGFSKSSVILRTFPMTDANDRLKEYGFGGGQGTGIRKAGQVFGQVGDINDRLKQRSDGRASKRKPFIK
jgi:hypothetical protein